MIKLGIKESLAKARRVVLSPKAYCHPSRLANKLGVSINELVDRLVKAVASKRPLLEKVKQSQRGGAGGLAGSIASVVEAGLLLYRLLEPMEGLGEAFKLGLDIEDVDWLEGGEGVWLNMVSRGEGSPWLTRLYVQFRSSD